MTTEQRKDVTDIAETTITAFNTSDWAQFRAALAPDVIYHETGTGRRAESADAYLQLVQAWKQAFPDATGTIRNVVAHGNTVVHEVEWAGTQTGDMATPAGVLPASGKQIAVLASLWYTFQGDTIQEVHHHLDIMTPITALAGATNVYLVAEVTFDSMDDLNTALASAPAQAAVADLPNFAGAGVTILTFDTRAA